MRVAQAALAGLIAVSAVPSASRAELTAAPETLPYDDEQPVPQGYHVEQRLRRGLLIGGGVTTGVGIGFLVAGKTSRGEIDRVVYTLLGFITCVPGVVLLTIGAVSRKEVLVRNDVVIVPWVGPGFAGLAGGFTF